MEAPPEAVVNIHFCRSNLRIHYLYGAPINLVNQQLQPMKKIKPIEKKKDGSYIIHLDADAANNDWIRMARLLRRAKAGDEEARKVLEELYITPMLEEEDTDESPEV